MLNEDRQNLTRRLTGENIWLSYSGFTDKTSNPANQINYEILETERAIGQAQFEELKRAAESKSGDITFVLLGGRGAQAMYKIIGELAPTGEIDSLLGKLHVFTQDALAPMSTLR